MAAEEYLNGKSNKEVMVSNLKYQPHIDGLRAIAVLSVLVFHLDPNWLPGGFVGVDIFFVISGYLITSIINREINQNKFTISNFYNRRIKRILPVYYAVALCSLATGYFLFFPTDLIELAKSTLASSLFVSNYYFWSSSGYFSKAVELKPLLHTWSLAVEEQFYIFWPLVLLGLSLFIKPKSQKIIIFILFFFAVASSVVLSITHSDFAYYSIITRAFELMIGAMFAIYAAQLKRLHSCFSLIALATLLFSIVFINKNMLFPGYIALIPCIATGVLIVNGNNTPIINKLLSTRAFVVIGLLSYSLYMWHWPVLAFTRYYYLEPTTLNLTLATALIFTLSIISRQFIEKPFLKKNWSITKSMKWLVFFPVGVIFITCIIIFQTDGIKSRYSDNELKLLNSSVSNANNCAISQETGKANEFCTFSSTSNKPNLKAIIWGDSHANHFKAMAESLVEQHSISIELVPFAGCPSIKDVYRINRSYSKTCFSHNKLVWERIRNNEFDIIILASNWANYPRGDNLADATDLSQSISNSKRSFYTNLESQITTLLSMKQKTIFVNSVPNFADDPTRCNLNKVIFNTNSLCDVDYAKIQNNKQSFNQFINQFNDKSPTFKVLDLDSAICDVSCSALKNGQLIYSDKNHLSAHGSQSMVPYFSDALKELNTL